MIILLSSLLIFLSGLFLSSSAPHTLMSILLTSTLLMVILLSLLNSFPWLAYILFLIFLGGILILFAYISSLSSNHLFKKIKMEVVVLFYILAMSTPLVSEAPTMANSWILIKYDTNMFMKELFSPSLYIVYLYLFMYLLTTLLYVVMIMKVYYAPLRSSLN